MKYAAVDFLKFKLKKIDKETLNLLTKIIEQNKNFREYYYKPTVENREVLAENRWDVRKTLLKVKDKIPKNELWILKDAAFILELYYHLSEAKMSLDYKSKHQE